MKSLKLIVCLLVASGYAMEKEKSVQLQDSIESFSKYLSEKAYSYSNASIDNVTKEAARYQLESYLFALRAADEGDRSWDMPLLLKSNQGLSLFHNQVLCLVGSEKALELKDLKNISSNERQYQFDLLKRSFNDEVKDQY